MPAASSLGGARARGSRPAVLDRTGGHERSARRTVAPRRRRRRARCRRGRMAREVSVEQLLAHADAAIAAPLPARLDVRVRSVATFCRVIVSVGGDDEPALESCVESWLAPVVWTVRSTRSWHGSARRATGDQHQCRRGRCLAGARSEAPTQRWTASPCECGTRIVTSEGGRGRARRGCCASRSRCRP